MNAIQELKGAVYPVLCRAGLSGFSNELSQELGWRMLYSQMACIVNADAPRMTGRRVQSA